MNTATLAEVKAVVDGSTIVVDVTDLEGLSHSPVVWGVVLMAVAMVGVARPRLWPEVRALLWGTLLTGAIGAALALATAPLALGRVASWVPMVRERLAESTLVVGCGGAAIAVLVTVCGLVLWGGRRQRRDVVIAAVALGLAIVGVVGLWQVQGRRRAVVTDLRAAFPVPRLVFVGQGLAPGEDVTPEERLPEVQVGHTRQLKALATVQLGVEDQRAPVFTAGTPPRAAFPVGDADAWRLAGLTATLEGKTPGTTTTTITAARGRVRVEQPVAYRVVDGTSPTAFSLTPSHQQHFVAFAGPPGTVDAVLRAGSPPKDTIGERFIEVLSVRARDGFDVARVRLRGDQGLNTIDVVARDGGLYEYPSRRPFFLQEPDGRCGLPALGFARCHCRPLTGDAGEQGGIESCQREAQDTAGAMMRVGLAVVTLGLSEVAGMCQGCGDNHEEGLLRVR